MVFSFYEMNYFIVKGVRDDVLAAGLFFKCFDKTKEKGRKLARAEGNDIIFFSLFCLRSQS